MKIIWFLLSDCFDCANQINTVEEQHIQRTMSRAFAEEKIACDPESFFSRSQAIDFVDRGMALSTQNETFCCVYQSVS